jgi:cytochrome c
MSGMEFNKIFAAILVAGIIGMTTGIIAEMLVSPEELEEPAFRVDTGAEPAEIAPAEEEALPPIAPLLAAADPAAGEDFTRACQACHNFEQGAPNKVGPVLWNTLGQPVAAHEGFNYSSTLQALNAEGTEWTYDNMNAFLAAPRDWAPGTTMSYAGVRSPEDRANLIAYLRTLSDDPVPLPEPTEAGAAEGEEPAAEGAAEAPAEGGAEPAAEGATEMPAEGGEAPAPAEGAEEPAAGMGQAEAGAGGEEQAPGNTATQ